MKFHPSLLATLSLIAATSCTSNVATTTLSGLNPDDFFTVVNGDTVSLFVLTNSDGMEAAITNYGGRIVSLMVPDRDGKMTDVVLGHDNIDDYINIDGNFGALIGRYGNRINQGRFTLDSITYQLPQNNYGHCLHGGPVGFHHSIWSSVQPNDSTLVLTLSSPDGSAGFPGNVNVEVTYQLSTPNAISISYKATTDRPTILNLTNHSYFNLNGDMTHDMTNDTVWINASHFTPIDSTFMTTGEILPVDSTVMDFRTPHTIAEGLASDYEQIKNGLGFDHNMVLDTNGDLNVALARLASPETGIVMEVYSTEPGLQFYTGNFLDGTVVGKKGVAYPRRGAICLETQHYPDSPNKVDWPSVVVRPGQTYSTKTIYRFSTTK